MTQISRPFQLALAAVALLGLVWAVALRGHFPGHGESTGSVPSAPAPAPNAKAQEQEAGKPTPIYHGAAPGVEGLTRAIAKAHEAVGTSQRNAQQLQQRSREASQEAPAATGAPQSSAGHATAQSAAAARHARELGAASRSAAARAREQSGSSSADRHSVSRSEHKAGSPTGGRAAAGRPAAQVAVEREVMAGKTVLLLFWTPSSSVDREVRSQAAAMVAGSHGKLTLHVAAPAHVGEFGGVTEVVHVYQTPTILIVNRRGIVSTLTGLTDTFALRQIVRQAERANG